MEGDMTMAQQITNEKYPLVSIVTPSYNQGQFIEDTILSVKNQDYPNIEHIIVDGESTDNTLEILKEYENSYNLRWISEPDNGQADAINKGFNMARGEIIGWLNSDDVYLTRNVITLVLHEFFKHPDIDLIHGNRITIDEFNHLLGLHYSREFNYNKFLRGYCTIYQQTVFLKRQIVNKYQLDSSLQLAMDTDFWLKIGQDYQFHYLNTFSACFRLHSISKTVSSAYIAEWNKERQYLNNRYGFRLNSSPFNKLSFRFGRLFMGSYFNYYRLPADLIQIATCPREEFAFPIKINGMKILWYLMQSANIFKR